MPPSPWRAEIASKLAGSFQRRHLRVRERTSIDADKRRSPMTSVAASLDESHDQAGSRSVAVRLLRPCAGERRRDLAWS